MAFDLRLLSVLLIFCFKRSVFLIHAGWCPGLTRIRFYLAFRMDADQILSGIAIVRDMILPGILHCSRYDFAWDLRLGPVPAMHKQFRLRQYFW